MLTMFILNLLSASVLVTDLKLLDIAFQKYNIAMKLSLLDVLHNACRYRKIGVL